MLFPRTFRSFCHGIMILVSAVWFALMGLKGPTRAEQDGSQERAQAILKAADIHGGFIVHLGCGDGRLTAALRQDHRYVVHGLDQDAKWVSQARTTIQKLGIYGPVSVERFDRKQLPYADNLVNLLVAEHLGGVSQEEALRVLTPGGKLYSQRDGQWTMISKARPKDIDEWTHFLHDASGNAVAHDDRVAPPGSLQWTAGPPYMRSHEHSPGIYALVSAGGRIFYIVDEAPTASVRCVPKWYLVARDAFNGIMLWKQPITQWYPHLINWGMTPPQLERRLVSVGERVYVTLGWHAPLVAINATTGAIVKEYKGTEGTEEVLWCRGTLLLMVRAVTEARRAEREKWTQLISRGEKSLEDRDSAEPLVKQLRANDAKGELSLMALEADSGRLLWKKAGTATIGLRPLSLCADTGQVCFQIGKDVVCLDLKTGGERWSQEAGRLSLSYAGNVICTDGTQATVLSAETGAQLWQQPHRLTSVHDVFVAGGSLWVGGFKPFPTKRGPSWGPYFVTQFDLKTGRVLKHIEPENPGHHHRCYPNKATDRYLLIGRRGTEFIDFGSGEVLWHSWARGVCRYGIMPCNGLLYVPPHACACYMAAKLINFNALAPRRPLAQAAQDESSLLERGPAYEGRGKREEGRGKRENAFAHPSSFIPHPFHDWPTYRHDGGRSGAASAPIPAKLKQRWQAKVGGKVAPLTIADGKVFAVSMDEQRVCAIDTKSGKVVWQFTVGGRVDSPPTIYQGRALLGCRDGWVYSVCTSDGQLAWRKRLAHEDRRIMAGGQLESISPVPGSVLVQNGVVYCTAGRSSYLDYGIDLYRLHPQTGQTLGRTPVFSPDPETGRQPPHQGPGSMPGAREDILSGDSGCIYLRDMVFDKEGKVIKEGNPHLFAMTAFLDDAWAHRSYWIFGTRCSVAGGCTVRDKKLIYGRLFAFSPSTIYGYGRAGIHWSNQLQDGPYRLFAVEKSTGSALWQKSLPIQVRAMILAGPVVFVAGPPVGTSVGPGDRTLNQTSQLLAVSATDGGILAHTELPGTPVFDGLAGAGGRLYISLKDGSVVCME